MKAIRYYAYGSPDVLKFEDVDLPTVSDNDVLVRVRAASLNSGDWHFMRGAPYIFRAQIGLSRPKAHGLGSDFAGQVEAVGKNVTELQPGDEVFGYAGSASGAGGTLAEYISLPQTAAVLRKPANLTFEQAASVPGAALTALQALRDKSRIQPGRTLLINGAAGGVGTFAVQIAKSLGAEVTGVCSTRNLEMVRSIGADEVVDHTKEDFTRSGHHYDVILDNVGNRPLSDCRRALTPTGTFIPNSGSGGRWAGPMVRILTARLLSLFVRQSVASFVAHANRDDLAILHELLETGKITPVIDRTYPLSDTADAIAYLEEGHAQGKVVITM
jgi:NADPH:quinone reductase-like Zn-dependent oxidoreductase